MIAAGDGDTESNADSNVSTAAAALKAADHLPCAHAVRAVDGAEDDAALGGDAAFVERSASFQAVQEFFASSYYLVNSTRTFRYQQI